MTVGRGGEGGGNAGVRGCEGKFFYACVYNSIETGIQ